MALACGDDDEHGATTSIDPDASSPDGSPAVPSADGSDGSDGDDAGTDAGLRSVTITVLDARGPKPDIRVVFHDATGAVLETKLTGADGKASSTGPLPAMASAALSAGSHIVTFVGVESGDDLVVRDPEPIDLAKPLGRYAVKVPTPFSGATQYVFLAGGCQTAVETSPSADVAFYPFCIREPATVLVRADQGYYPQAYAFKKGNPVLTDGGTLEVTTGAWANWKRFEFAHRMGEGSSRQLLEIADGHGYQSVKSTLESPDLAAYSLIEGFADELQATAWVPRRMLIKRFAPTDRVEFDPADLPPLFSDPSFDASDPTRPRVAWASDTTNTDGGYVYLTFGPETAPRKYRWTFIVPPGTASVVAPALPSELAAPWSDDAGAVAYRPPQILFLEGDVIPSYADFRRRLPIDVSWELAQNGPYLPPLPVAGYYRVMYWLE